MMRHLWTVYCRQVITDKSTNAVSLMHVLETLNVDIDDDSPKVAVAFDAVLITVWGRREWDNPVKCRMRAQMVAPNDDVLADNVREVDLTEHHIRRMLGKGNMFVVTTSGVYEWVISREGNKGEWVEEARIPVRVEVNRNPSSTQEAPAS